jgi:hypothetical protein
MAAVLLKRAGEVGNRNMHRIDAFGQLFQTTVDSVKQQNVAYKNFTQARWKRLIARAQSVVVILRLQKCKCCSYHPRSAHLSHHVGLDD